MTGCFVVSNEKRTTSGSQSAFSWSKTAKNGDEFRELCSFLGERELIQVLGVDEGKFQVKLKAKGFEAVVARTLLPPSTVFISSTCFDLLDLRQELRDHLTNAGADVRLSEVPEAFEVPSNSNSFEICLQNLDSSDIVFCILDRRYGGVASVEPYTGKSATEIEIEHAIKVGKPIRFFIRDKAESDSQQYRADSTYKTRWIEPHNDTLRKKLCELIASTTRLVGDRPNWRDLFSSSVDLKRIATKRLLEFRRFQQ